jgi:hypothetical protein
MPVLPPASHLQRLAIGRAVLLCLRDRVEGERWLMRYQSAKVEQVRAGGVVVVSWVNIERGGIAVAHDVAYSRDPKDGTWCWPDDAVYGRLNGLPFLPAVVATSAEGQGQ